MTGSARLKMLKIGERRSLSSSARTCWRSMGATGASSDTGSLPRQVHESLFEVGADNIDVHHVVSCPGHYLAHDRDRLGAEDAHTVAVDLNAARGQRFEKWPRRRALEPEDDLLTGDPAL